MFSFLLCFITVTPSVPNSAEQSFSSAVSDDSRLFLQMRPGIPVLHLRKQNPCMCLSVCNSFRIIFFPSQNSKESCLHIDSRSTDNIASSSTQSLYSVPPAPDSFCRLIDFITDLTEGFPLHFHFGDNCVLCRCVMVSPDNLTFRLALDVLPL